VLAWLGVVVSITWVVGLPLQLAEVLRGPIVTWVIFVPMAAFEVPFALWLLIKASPPDSRSLLLPYDLLRYGASTGPKFFGQPVAA